MKVKSANGLLPRILDSRIVLASSCLGFGAAIAVLVLASLIKDNTLQLLINLIITPTVTLVAAWAGARVAFDFQSKKEREATIAANVSAANRAIFQLVRFANLFHLIEKQFIAEERQNMARHFEIRPGMQSGVEDIDIDFDSLEFLFHSPTPDVLRTLALAQLEVNSTISTIRQRDHVHVEQFQLAMDAVPAGTVMTVNQVEEIVGERISLTLRKLTDDVISGIDRAAIDLRIHIDGVRRAVREMYPGHPVVILRAPSSDASAKA